MCPEWNGDERTRPSLPPLPRHYYMAWRGDEDGAPPPDKRTIAYDNRRAGIEVVSVVQPPEQFTDGSMNFDIRAKPPSWSDESDEEADVTVD